MQPLLTKTMAMSTRMNPDIKSNSSPLPAVKVEAEVDDTIVEANSKLDSLAKNHRPADKVNSLMKTVQNERRNEIDSAPPKTAAEQGSSRADAPSASPDDDFNVKEQEATFPEQLMDAIEQETNDEAAVRVKGERVLEWLPSGKSFVIRDKKSLEKDVLPKHFTAKCKFMSFVRKLYRWGFRQIEKNAPGVMIFTNECFVRGDKKRCHMMRSIVKKPTGQVQVPYSDLAGCMPFNNALQGFGSNMLGPNNQYDMDQAFMRNSMAAHSFPSQQQARQMHPSFNQVGDSGIGMGMQSSRFMPNQAHLGGMTSFDAGLRLERMEHRQQQLMNMYKNSNGHVASPFNSQPAGMALSNNYVNPKAGQMSEIELASELIKRDPGIEPWRALELAECFNRTNK